MFKHNCPLDFLNFTDIEIAEWLCKICGDDFVYKDKELFVWIEKQKRWHQDDNKTSLTIEYISKRLTQEGKKQIKKRGIDKILDSDEPDNISKSQMELVKKITQLKILKHTKPIAESFLIKLVNRFDDIEFDKNPYLYAFKNCVYDFKDKNFRAILKSDYLMMNTQYNWEQPTNDQVNEVASIFESIFPNKDARKGYASVLFSGLLGICPEKFVMANGSGRNCKGLLHDLFKSMSGDYACKGHIDVLIEKMKSGANPEVASFHKKRAIFFSEPDITHPLNVASLKEL
jgi:phage/plasmid-associated DNA primase